MLTATLVVARKRTQWAATLQAMCVPVISRQAAAYARKDGLAPTVTVLSVLCKCD